MAEAASQVTAEDVNDILVEIDKATIRKINEPESVNWNEIIDHMKTGEINYIKNLITSSKININAQNPENGMTLLLYAIVIGNYDLVKAICNFGADVSIKDNDGDDAIKYAITYGRLE